MKLITFQITFGLWADLRRVLHAVEGLETERDTGRATMRALCTALLEDGLKHRKVEEIQQLMIGKEVKRGRPAMPEAPKPAKEEAKPAQGLAGWDKRPIRKP